MIALRRPLALTLVTLLSLVRVAAAQEQAPVNDKQIAVMLLVDYGRSYGYQVMMARIQLDRDRAQFERDATLLKQKQELYERKSIPLVELEIAQLKDTWNKAQLVVAEKNLAYVQAEYQAMVQLAKHFGGVPQTTDAIYATFRKGWEAGCEKGPDEVAATKARLDFMEKVVARAEQLYRQRNESLSSLLDKQAQLGIAQAEYQNRAPSLESCRKLLFPSLEEIMAIKP
ncbi:hypothetical protein [Bradyrhizobium sp. USDA 4353]